MSEVDRWKRAKEIFDSAVAGRVEDRAALVRDLCGDDLALRAEIESLLAADAGNESVFTSPVNPVLRGRVFGVVADVLGDGTHALAAGDRLGAYQITGFLGAGGMGRVYRARDTTLDRDVALKILPDRWLADPDRRARFEREARLLAALNHPNVGSIYGVQEGDPSTISGSAVKALVLELVEGQTLAERIAHQARPTMSRRGLPIDEVVGIASQVIEALEAAHARGIVHRDLKPANIKITPEARVKVLDFGIARAPSVTDGSLPTANSPTGTPGDTQAGLLLGTAPYMSPEQARGRTVDKRSDIWAFGCVLYEMLTGAPAFVGDNVAEVLANVIKAEPDWTALPSDTPASLRLCAHRCLQKDSRQRFHDIADVRLALEGAFEQPTRDSGDSTEHGGPSYARLAYAGWAIALAAVAGAFAIVAFAPGVPAEVPETRLEIVTPPAADPLSFAISPDGRSVVFQAGQDPPKLWLRPLDSLEARPLAGTEGGLYPFWSPDSRSVGFTAGGALKRLDLSSGLVRTLARRSFAGGAWSVDGTILMGSVIGPLYSVQADDGTVKQATTLLEGQSSHRWPQFLPGGRFLFFTLGPPDVRGLYLGSTSDANVNRISERESGYRFMSPAHTLFARKGALWARSLNSDGATLEKEPVPVAPRVLVSRGFFGYGAFSSSSTGSIAYRASAGETQLLWLDRTGRPVSTVGQADDAQMHLYHLSRDGSVAAVTRTIAGQTNVWLLDTERGVPRRLTFDVNDNDVNDNDVVLSPDGTRAVHQANGPRDGSVVYERRADGTGGEIQLLEESVSEWHHPQDWSADGRYIVYAVTTTTGVDLRVLPLSGERAPFDIARTPFAELNARFSPDSRWVAYESNETGRLEVYVQPFPGPGPKVQVSVDGGTMPRWRRDGGELFYLAPDRRLMVASVSLRGSRLVTSPPRALFTLTTTSSYEPSPDGRRFLVTAVASEASPITVILNWKPPGR